MVSENGTPTAPPYISFRTFLNLLDRLDEGGIPQRLDRSYWGSFLAGGLGGQVMVALRSLGLANSVTNEPTAVLEHLVDRSKRKQVLLEVLRARYAPVFEAVDLSRGTAGQLDEAFRKQYKLDGHTLRKVVTFFVHAAQYAELPVSPYIAKKTRKSPAPAKRSAGQRTPRRARSEPDESPSPARVNSAAVVTTADKPNGITREIALRSGGKVWVGYSLDLFDLDESDQKFVMGLIATLRSYGQELPGGDASHREALPDKEGIP
jgi:hypothetical protein